MMTEIWLRWWIWWRAKTRPVINCYSWIRGCVGGSNVLHRRISWYPKQLDAVDSVSVGNGHWQPDEYARQCKSVVLVRSIAIVSVSCMCVSVWRNRSAIRGKARVCVGVGCLMPVRLMLLLATPPCVAETHPWELIWRGVHCNNNFDNFGEAEERAWHRSCFSQANNRMNYKHIWQQTLPQVLAVLWQVVAPSAQALP